MAEPLLALDGVRAGYGTAIVLDGVTFDLPERGSLAVLGRNGVGKTTLLLTIMGYDADRAAAAFCGAAQTSPASRRTAARAAASAGWRRSARFSPR